MITLFLRVFLPPFLCREDFLFLSRTPSKSSLLSLSLEIISLVIAPFFSLHHRRRNHQKHIYRHGREIEEKRRMESRKLCLSAARKQGKI